MPRTPETLFESPEERAQREPIFYLTKTAEDPKTRERKEKKFVSVIGVELEVNDGPEGTRLREEEFKDFCLDDKAKELLKFLATNVKLNHSPLIEGETDIGKTKALEYLSFLTNNKMVRVSVKGTTDPTEFFGKHVPESETAKRKIASALKRKAGISPSLSAAFDLAAREQRVLSLSDLKELAKCDADAYEGLQEESRAIFAKPLQEGRGLNREEWERLAEIEGIDLEGKTFKWQDGEVVKQMTGNAGQGYWTYIDEIGAAEPQILVALNRVLEQYKRIELTEDGARLVEAGPNCRLTATTNPPEYAGRLPLALDFIRRWRYTKSGELSPEILAGRAKHIFREFKDQELVDVILPLVNEFHVQLRKNIKTITKDQKQKFNYEFSDIIAIRDYLKDSGIDESLKTLKGAIEYGYLTKIGDEKVKETYEKAFDQLIKSLGIEKKIQELMAKRVPEQKTRQDARGMIETLKKKTEKEIDDLVL